VGNNKNKRSEFLGVNLGTASNRLRKMVLFKLVQDTEQDDCYRCGKVIESVEELSIEHKERWLDVSVDLFWDMGNIAFSHLRCNSADGERKNREKTHCPRGHPYDEENTRVRKDRRKGGPARYCIACDVGRKR
jgi:hypothetical protein